MLFRRPELEKDNPIAPQPYIGPRRRLAMARAAASTESTEVDDMKETLQNLVEAASRYVNSLPGARRTGKSLKALHGAIIQAERVLSVERVSSSLRKSHPRSSALSSRKARPFEYLGERHGINRMFKPGQD